MEVTGNENITAVSLKDLEVAGNSEVISIGADDLQVKAVRRVYTLVNDDVYIPTGNYDDAPEWVRNAIKAAVDFEADIRDTDLLASVDSVLSLFETGFVPRNEYDNFVVSQQTENSSLNAKFESLDSSLDTLNSTVNSNIQRIDETYVTETDATALVAEGIQTSIADEISGTSIGSSIAEVSQSVTDLDTTMASNFTVLESTLAGESDNRAAAVETINTYVGIDEVGASTGTGLSGYLEASDGTIGGADSEIVNTIRVTAEDIESKWSYNSTVNIDGVYYSSGFGLNSSAQLGGSGTQGSPYTSEFWIDASKLKFTNSSQTGQTSPFTIDATGSQPNITFNGLVTFGSNQTGTIDEAIANSVNTISVGDKNINITDNLIPTTSLIADVDNSGYQFVGNPVKSNAAGIDSFAEPQVTLDSNDEVYSPFVDEVSIAYYFRFGIKGDADLSSPKIVTVDSSDNITYGTLNVTLEDGVTLNGSDWYIIDGIINPFGGNSDDNGSVRIADGTKIGTIDNFVLPSSAVKTILGWVNDCTISRMKLAKITADTITGSIASTDYVDEYVTALNTDLSSVNTTIAQQAIDIATVDSRVDSEEAARINAINAEAQTRASAITARINAEALLDGKIDDEEAARIASANALTTAYTNYANAVKQALIDGEISTAEANAIAQAESKVNAAKAELQANIDAITRVEDISWQSEVQAAINDNVTTIDGGKIVTNEAFVNNLNAQGGIIADNVTANDFYGKNFYGGYFEGALIVGAVLKASYLDLDGELEVLTNYHIPVATYNSNPSLYTDAIYTETANEYRIPSLSTVYETVKNQSIPSGSWMDGLIKAYDVANAGHNNKAVKIRPFIIIAANTTIISGSLTMQGSGGYSPTSTLSGTTSFSIYFGGSSFVFSFNHATGGHYAWGDDSNIWGGVTTPTFIGNGTTGNASYSYNIPNDYSPPTVSASGSKTFSALGLSFTMYYSVVGYALSYSLRVNTGTTFATSDLVSASMFRIKCNSIGSGSGSRYAKASSSIQVNNMA